VKDPTFVRTAQLTVLQLAAGGKTLNSISFSIYKRHFIACVTLGGAKLSLRKHSSPHSQGGFNKNISKTDTEEAAKS